MSREPISKPECRDRPVCCARASAEPSTKWLLHRVQWPTESNHDRSHSSSKGHHLGLAVIARRVLLPGVLAELIAYPAPMFADSAASVRMMRTQSDTLKKHDTDDDDLKKMYTIPVERS